MLFAFGLSSFTTPPSIFVANENFSAKEVKGGLTNVEEGRFGDYFASSLDPDGQSLWIAGVYGGVITPQLEPTSHWATYLIEIS